MPSLLTEGSADGRHWQSLRVSRRVALVAPARCALLVVSYSRRLRTPLVSTHSPTARPVLRRPLHHFVSTARLGPTARTVLRPRGTLPQRRAGTKSLAAGGARLAHSPEARPGRWLRAHDVLYDAAFLRPQRTCSSPPHFGSDAVASSLARGTPARRSLVGCSFGRDRTLHAHRGPLGIQSRSPPCLSPMRLHSRSHRPSSKMEGPGVSSRIRRCI
jgi:hypothetical protein